MTKILNKCPVCGSGLQYHSMMQFTEDDKLYLVYDFSGVRILYFREFDYDDSGNVVSLLFSDSFSDDAFFIRFYLVDFVGFFIEFVECEDYLQ